ncbi:hypothetical protein [Kosakonia sp. MUSA4]|uniref:hypothetical protein n=1 Tax=Kosakonia sp. MUSA4 TaxID=2067958 RepID=UPI0015992197|nr:hypothetical protein [Kosakonia sp. MUSA4]QJT82429.1 hypothetical protein C0557_21300 [Kosakonia sp. MUSA4]
MKTLSVQDMNNVSGAYSWNSWTSIFSNTVEAIASAALGAALGFAAGAAIGGKHGGDGGGLIGVGSVGQLVGMLGAGVIGAVTIGITGTISGFESTMKNYQNFLDGLFDGTFIP